MAVSPEFLTFVLDQLTAAGPVSSRRMFGGAGIYLEGKFFALIDDDVLYLKVDDTNRGAFEAAGSGPFRPRGRDGYVMDYYAVPADVLEDADSLRTWARASLAVAHRAEARQAGA